MSRLRYIDPQSSQTLREGVLEARVAEGAEDAVGNVSSDLVQDIHAHDAIHVLFGCSTDLRGEILAHVWTVFGTTMTMADMHRVNRHADHRQALKEIGYRRLLRTWATTLPLIVITVVSAWRMRRRWVADDFEQHLDQSLETLRAEYGIRLTRHRAGAVGRGGAWLRRAQG